MDIQDAERIRTEDGYIVECMVCGKSFEASRIDASFCSSTCRSRHHRAAGKLTKRIERGEAAVNDLIKHLPKSGESETYNALLRLSRRIAAALAAVEMD